MITIDRNKAKELILATEGTIFKAIFRKKTTDETGKRRFRRMVCRKGVKKHVKGVGMPYDPKDYNLIGVYDMQKKADINRWFGVPEGQR